MSNSRAYVFSINPVGSGPDEVYADSAIGDAGHSADAVHQVSPCWVLSFIRWSVRDTLRTKATQTLDFHTTREADPLVVENDCISCSVVVDKGTLTDSMSAMLKMTDVNYETSIAPGDFVMINMLNWEVDSRRVANAARAHLPINGVLDGFKGVFKVQGVRKVLAVNPQTGNKEFFIKITGFAFTEFNNTIYFSPEMLTSSEKNNVLLYISNIANNWSLLTTSKKGVTNIQQIMELLIDSFLGTGIGDDGQMAKGGLLKSANTLFYMPSIVGVLLGVPNAKAAKDVYNFLFGIQQYSAISKNPGLAVGMNPSNILSGDGRIWKPKDPNQYCKGEKLSQADYWNQVKVWAIFNEMTNAPLNELFSCFRVSPSGRVMPTVVFRQIPFTTEDFDNSYLDASGHATTEPTTKFFNLPRWKINPSLILDYDIGRDESARVNFVQYFGRSTFGPDGFSIAQDIAGGNFLYDIGDVQRSGLRPYVITTTFDESTSNKPDYKAQKWAKILGDALIGGHLKMNGTIVCAGIVAPIAVGDNLELDGVVYHIERVGHTCGIDANTGNKIFRTTIGLSSGLSKDSSNKGTAYAEMSQGGAKVLRETDFSNNQILPGVSESQDVVYRPNDLDTPLSAGGQFKQPNLNTSVNKTGVENVAKEKDKK